MMQHSMTPPVSTHALTFTYIQYVYVCLHTGLYVCLYVQAHADIVLPYAA